MVGEQRNRWTGWVLRLPFFLFALATFVPYYWMVTGAFKPVPELLKNPPSFLIANPTLNNFYDPTPTAYNHVAGLFQQFEDVPLRFGQFFLNSLFITLSVTVLSLIVCSLIAFVLAKHHFPGRNFIFVMILASMMVPWQVNLIPNFLTMKAFGWLTPANTFFALIIPALPKAFAVFFLRQYMVTLPDALMDAARIDGANEWRIWAQIILPLCGPALAAVSIFMLLGEWNSFVWPLIVIQDSAHLTLPVALSRLNTSFAFPNTRGVLMAGALIVSVPAVLVFLLFQRQFIQSVALTGVKG